MPIGRRPPLFKLRASLVGKIRWVCPYCGNVTKSHLPPTVYRLQCTYRNCRRKFLYGLQFFQMPGGGAIKRPLDTIVPEFEAMPEAALAPRAYKNGSPVHELVEAEPHGNPHDIGLNQTE